MFSFLTINCCTNFVIQSISYIDNREFTREGAYPGPFVYQLYIYSEPINIVPSVMFYLNNWLADGLLVSLVSKIVVLIAYVSRSTVPSLLYYLRRELLDHGLPVPGIPYLAWYALWPSVSRQAHFQLKFIDIATGAIAVAQIIRPDIILRPAILFDLIYLPISLSLTIILTLMIITRLVLHSRKLQHATGSWASADGPYKAIVTILVESYALYAVTFIVSLGLEWAANPFQYTFFPIVAGTQVRAS